MFRAFSNKNVVHSRVGCPVCVSKLLQEVWGIILLFVFLVVVVLCITVFKERPLGGLMKKNLLIRRNKMCKSFCSQICEVLVVAILVVVVLGITGTMVEVVDVGQEPLQLQIVYTVPDSNRQTFLHVMSPFGKALSSPLRTMGKLSSSFALKN